MSSSVLGPAADSAARPGSCRKPPSLLYVESGKERDLLAFVVRRELTAFLRSGAAGSNPATPTSSQATCDLRRWLFMSYSSEDAENYDTVSQLHHGGQVRADATSEVACKPSVTAKVKLW